jgi:hypothetical protein
VCLNCSYKSPVARGRKIFNINLILPPLTGIRQSEQSGDSAKVFSAKKALRAPTLCSGSNERNYFTVPFDKVHCTPD